MNSDNKFLIGVLIVVVLVIGGIVYSSTHKPVTKLNVDLTQGQKVGPDTAKLKIVEFGDFQCPACAQEAPVVRAFQQQNPNDVQLIFRNFPLITIHANTQLAARAGQAAALQGKFWQMYDLLYSDQGQWESLSDPTNTFIGYAGQLNLNTTQFKTDLNSEAVKNVVTADYNYALAQGFDSTPTFVVNGQKYTGGITNSQWQQFLNSTN